jgi:hypothetical protein
MAQIAIDPGKFHNSLGMPGRILVDQTRRRNLSLLNSLAQRPIHLLGWLLHLRRRALLLPLKRRQWGRKSLLLLALLLRALLLLLTARRGGRKTRRAFLRRAFLLLFLLLLFVWLHRQP